MWGEMDKDKVIACLHHAIERREMNKKPPSPSVYSLLFVAKIAPIHAFLREDGWFPEYINVGALVGCAMAALTMILIAWMSKKSG